MTNKGKRGRRTLSMHGIMLLMMCGITLASAVLFIAVASLSGVRRDLDDLAYRTLYNHASDSVSTLSSELNVVSRASRQAADELGVALSAYMAERGLTPDGARGDVDGIDGMLALSAAPLTDFLESNSASGAFVMLNTSYTDETHSAALYLRDPSPRVGAGAAADNVLLRGHPRVLGGDTLALDQTWQYEQSLMGEDTFFRLPQEIALRYPRADRRDWGYWSRPLRMTEGDIEVIAFTTPLLDAQGGMIGIFGAEYSLRYLQQIMPSENLPFDGGFYIICKTQDMAILPETAFSASTAGSKFLFDHAAGIPLDPMIRTRNYEIFTSGGRQPFYLAFASLDLYGENSPYAAHPYYLVAVAPRAEVMSTSTDITRSIMISIGISLALGILCSLLLSRTFARRIENLASQVRDVRPDVPLSLKPTAIREVDELAEVIQTMNRDIRAYSARMASIVDIVGIALGSFEIDRRTGSIAMTDSLRKMLDIDLAGTTAESFLAMLPGIRLPERDGAHSECEVRLDGADNEERWFRVHLLLQEEHLYGTIIDISEEIRQKRWLEFERDYDPLTHLLNRNAYPAKMEALLDAAPDGDGVMVFGDLDNLKTINDTFGHDMGDRYIRIAAMAMERFKEYGGVVARISGDEFVAYVHGHQGREKLDEMLGNVLGEIRDTEMALPDGSMQRVRISVGIARYPDDSRTIDELIRFADFAMYEIKHSVKGGTKVFDRASYEKNSFILNKPNQLDLLIEERRLRFAFQPIVDVRTGKPFGFEALMRPQMREFHTPLEVIQLAKAQWKLYQIEKLTLSCFFEFLRKNEALLADYSFFVNLIANQMLSDDDIAELRAQSPPRHDRVVMEITESENGGEEMIRTKLESIRASGYRVALDDYGTGYNSEVSLLVTNPDYLKVDMSIVRNIDGDPNRQRMMRTIAEYARDNGILVIAEGVETAAEMDTVIALGTDYIQGYFTGKPDFEPGVYEERNSALAPEMYEKYHRGRRTP